METKTPELFLDLDFSEVTELQMGRTANYAPAGLYEAEITSFKVFEEKDKGAKLYVYMKNEAGQLLSDNYKLGEKLAMTRLASFLASTGQKAENFLGKKPKVPMHKLVGKKCYVRWTPAEMVNGVKVEGSYSKCGWFTHEAYTEAIATTDSAPLPVIKQEPKQQEASAPVKGNAGATIEAAPAVTGDDDWLTA